MPTPNLNERAKFNPLLTIAASTFTGSYQVIGTITKPSSILMVQNDTTVTVTLSDDGVTDGKNFIPGERCVLDDASDSINWPSGTTFYAKGAAGTGNFQVSYIFAN